MPGGKKVTPLFGVWVLFLSTYLPASEIKALAKAAPPPYVVVLDPGHGGPDRGASGKLGPKRMTEKEVALSIALKTARALSNPAYYRALGRPVKVVLTRRSDKAVPLERRSERAKKLHADLFVSIHANSEPSGRARGLETYFLNNTDDESSLKLQQIENRSSKRNPAASSLLLRSVAADAVVDSSRSAAEILQSSMMDQLRSEDPAIPGRGVRQAMLYVLLDSQVPAVLVEAFYLSNRKDLLFLSRQENRDRIAEGLAKGVLRFLATR